MNSFLRFFISGFFFLNYTTDNSLASNKESYTLIKENFFDLLDIDIKGLSIHLHYSFKNEALLREALRPLLPKQLQLSKVRFEHLEFLGDAVMGSFIRERLITLFPTQKRSVIVSLYDQLTRNKTLADVYLRNLNLERYLPFPEVQSCKYCNLIEALVGAIHCDDQDNGPKNSKKFIMRILDDHILGEKIQEVFGSLKITLIPAIHPKVSKVLMRVCTPERVAAEHPKSLLSEVLNTLWNDTPVYQTSIKIDQNGKPYFIAIIEGSQIGSSIRGTGNTGSAAKQAAACNALNFLAGKELIPLKKAELIMKNFKTLLKEYQDQHPCKIEFVTTMPHHRFMFQVKVNNITIGEGNGASKSEAKEHAAREAFFYLIKDDHIQSPSKNYHILLKEHTDFEYCDVTPPHAEFKVQAIKEGQCIGEGSGLTLSGAEECVAQMTYLHLIGEEERKAKHTQIVKYAGIPKEAPLSTAILPPSALPLQILLQPGI